MGRTFKSLVRPAPPAPKGAAPGFRSLNGIRVIAIATVALGHTYAFMSATNKGTYGYGLVKNRFSAVGIIGSPLTNVGLDFISVDTFFWLSGFLAQWVLIEVCTKMKLPGQADAEMTSASSIQGTAERLNSKSGGGSPMLSLAASVKFYFMSLFQRFLRITPVYAFTLLLYIYIYPLVGNGPGWMSEETEKVTFCKEYWWTNLLYISNLYPGQFADSSMSGDTDKIGLSGGEGELGCMIQSWYLPNDMQMFLVAPLVALLFRASREGFGKVKRSPEQFRTPWMAHCFVTLLCVASWVYVGWYSRIFKESVCDVSNPANSEFGRRLMGHSMDTTPVDVSTQMPLDMMSHNHRQLRQMGGGGASQDCHAKFAQASEEICEYGKKGHQSYYGTGCYWTGDVSAPTTGKDAGDTSKTKGSCEYSPDFQIDIYDKSWARFPPYGVGLILACLYVQLRDPRTKEVPKFPLPLALVLWALALGLMFFFNFGAYWGGDSAMTNTGSGKPWACAWPRWFDLFYSTFFRAGFCIGVSLMTWLCLAGQGGPIGYFLSMHIWTPLARLTFGIYLFHVMVVDLLYGSGTSFAYTDYLGAYIFVANYTLALAGSVCLHVLVEKPFANISMLLFAPRR